MLSQKTPGRFYFAIFFRIKLYRNLQGFEEHRSIMDLESFSSLKKGSILRFLLFELLNKDVVMKKITIFAACILSVPLLNAASPLWTPDSSSDGWIGDRIDNGETPDDNRSTHSDSPGAFVNGEEVRSSFPTPSDCNRETDSSGWETDSDSKLSESERSNSDGSEGEEPFVDSPDYNSSDNDGSYTLPYSPLYSGDELPKKGWSPSLEQEAQIIKNKEDYDSSYLEKFSPQAHTALEAFYKKHDIQIKGKKATKFQTPSKRSQRDEPALKHEPRVNPSKRTIDPFGVITPDLLGNQQLGKKTDSRLTSVRGKSNIPERNFHGEAGKRQAAFERSQARLAQPATLTVQQVVVLMASARIK